MPINDIRDIYRIIESIVLDKIDRGERVSMNWAVTEVLNGYPDITGEDADFYKIAARDFVAGKVKGCIKKYDGSFDSVTPQMVLDGFEHLQKAYPVKRGKSRELVPVDQLTDRELLARAEELRAMAKGCRKHAKEIEDYVSHRRQTA